MIGGARYTVARNPSKKIDFKTFALRHRVFYCYKLRFILSHISGEARPTFGRANANFYTPCKQAINLERNE